MQSTLPQFKNIYRAGVYPRAAANSEIVIDSFAGGGGASTGIEAALKTAVDVAINHNADAVACHERNHPNTRHFCQDIYSVDPRVAAAGRKVGLLWASPDCTHHSKAKGKAPRKKKIRGLANRILYWARLEKPRVIILENVEEFQRWCRLDKRSKQANKNYWSELFLKFVRRLIQHGYAVEWNVLNAADYGAPTARRRLFLIARCDGEKIIWPKPTHGINGKLPSLTAADCIDFSLPTPSIFLSKNEAAQLRKETGIICKRPLGEKTLARIARGVQKFVIDSADPFVIGIDNQSGNGIWAANSPLRTVTSKARFALVAPTIAKHYTGVTGHRVDKTLGTITGVDHHSLVTSYLHHYHGQRDKNNVRGFDIKKPFATIAGQNRFAEVRAFLTKFYGTGTGQNLASPIGTITAKDRFGLVTVAGEKYQIADIGMRMLTPTELLRAQFGEFADGYKLTGSKAKQVKMIGNSVCPHIARALVKANYKRQKSN